MDTMNTAKLVSRLENAQAAYYNGTPILSDAAYDALEDKLRTLNPDHPFLSKIGAPAPKDGAWPKVKHGQPMSSLNKVQTPEEMAKWFKRFPNTDMALMDKLDGISISLRYEKGYFVQALTRGDGNIGEDITRNVRLMKGVPHTLNGEFSGYVRGEIVCLHDDFEKYFPDESNPRNTASGTAKRQSDYDMCAHLTVISYSVLSDDNIRPCIKTKHGEFAWLAVGGFLLPEYSFVSTAENVQKIYDEYIASKRNALNYDIDGLVITVDDHAVAEAAGERNKRPAGAIAFKFPHETAETTLRDIVWQVGSSGRITPVAQFDTVRIAGANISQASLHNVANIKRLAVTALQNEDLLAKGDRILVARRNDVVPYIEEVLEAANGYQVVTMAPPIMCPSCHHRLEMVGEYLVCKNSDACTAQASGVIKRWVKKIGVLHVGETLIDAWYDAGLIADIADLYTLDLTEACAVTLKGGQRAGGSASKAIGNLHAKKILPLATIVGSLGISLIGRSMAQIIVDGGFDTLDKMYAATVSDIATLAKVGQTKAECFVHGLKAKELLVGKLFANGIERAVLTGPLVGMTFCVTGFRDAALAEALVEAGATQKSNVSKGLSYLILKDANSASGKAVKARRYGTACIDADTAWLLAGGSNE